LNYKKREKRPKHPTVEARKVSPELARKMIYGFLFVSLISPPLAFLQAQHANQNLTTIEHNLKAFKKSSEENQQSNQSQLFKPFMNEFLPVYINLTNRDEDYTKRQENLKQFFSFDYPDLLNEQITRNLLSSEFYDLSQGKQFNVATYKISYDVKTPVTKTRTVQKKVNDKKSVSVEEKYIDYEHKTIVTMINIPIKQIGSKYKVMAMPYLTSIPSLVAGKTDALPTGQDELSSADATTSSAIESFLKNFYQKYTTGELDQVSYMMKDAEVLSDNFEVVEPDISVYLKGKSFVAYVNFNLKNKETQDVFPEQMTLQIVKKDGNFYIDKMTHYMGGI
jgi:hypothetical protein